MLDEDSSDLNLQSFCFVYRNNSNDICIYNC